jgi:hypothetical protein
MVGSASSGTIIEGLADEAVVTHASKEALVLGFELTDGAKSMVDIILGKVNAHWTFKSWRAITALCSYGILCLAPCMLIRLGASARRNPWWPEACDMSCLLSVTSFASIPQSSCVPACV